jgi:phage terminase small subunit
MDAKLTPRQAAFVREFLVDLSAAAAARRAGYSARTARSAGQRLLTNVDVAASIRAAMAERARRTRISSDAVVQKLAAVAFADVRALFHADGSLKPVGDLCEDAAVFIAGLDVATTLDGDGTLTRTTKVRFSDRLRALELLGRHVGLFGKSQPGTAENPIAVLIRHAQGTALPVVAEPPADDGDDDDWPQAA